MMTELFQQVLNINSPWFIKSTDFNAEEKQLVIGGALKKILTVIRHAPASIFILGTPI